MSISTLQSSVRLEYYQIANLYGARHIKHVNQPEVWKRQIYEFEFDENSASTKQQQYNIETDGVDPSDYDSRGLLDSTTSDIIAKIANTNSK